MKIKPSDLTGAALDWAVAKCEGNVQFDSRQQPWLTPNGVTREWVPFHPSTDWSQGGPIIEQKLLTIESPGLMGGAWCSSRFGVGDRGPYGYGPTPLIAAMRCLVASKLGDEVDVPEELL